MDSRRNSQARLLAGLQVGILGGLATVAWFVTVSLLSFGAPWTLMNLFSASVRHSPWTFQFGFQTIVGMASHLFACGAFGILLGWILPRPSAMARFSIPGAVFSVILSLLLYEFFWMRHIPRLREYVAPGPMLVVHLLFGACVARFPAYFLQLAPPMPEPREIPRPQPPDPLGINPPAPEPEPPMADGTTP